MFSPLSKTLPAVGSTSRTMARPSVVLPQPLSPTSPSVSPGSRLKLTSSTAFTNSWAPLSSPCFTGKCTFTFLTSSSGIKCVLQNLPYSSRVPIQIRTNVPDEAQLDVAIFSPSPPQGGEGRPSSVAVLRRVEGEEACYFPARIPSSRPSPRSGGERESTPVPSCALSSTPCHFTFPPAAFRLTCRHVQTSRLV